jgi:hypothetical protein
MRIAVAKEIRPGEKRVALVPDIISKLTKAGLEVVIESGAGVAAGFPDEQLNPYHPFSSAVDGNADNNISVESNPYATYWSATAPATGVFYLNDFTGTIDKFNNVNIDRINVYNVYRDNKFGTSVKISITDTAGAVTDRTVSETVDGLATGRFNLIESFTSMSGVSISGIGGNGIPTLDQIEILDYRRNRGLINYDFTTGKIHQQEGFLIGMWTEFPNNSIDVKKINLVHNIKTGCQYSGFNVYLNGSDLVCDFAVVSVSGVSPVSTIIHRSITGSAYNLLYNGRRCTFLENYQLNGHSTGAPLGRIRLADERNDTLCEYYLEQKNTGTNFSGEYFLFKDPTKQDGIGNLSFGINEWQDYPQGLVYTSPIRWGSMAVWETASNGDSDPRYASFGRNNTAEVEEFYEFKYLNLKLNLCV